MHIPEYWLYWTYTTAGLLKTPLITEDGRTARILGRGTRNRFAGPDFQGALVEIDGVRERGDVEFHVHIDDWHRHGHDQDRRYDAVLLHMVWDLPSGVPAELNERFPHISIRKNLNLAEESWLQRMAQLDAGIATTGREDQAMPLQALSSFTSNDIAGFARQRFVRKADRYRDWRQVFSFEDVCFIALAECLGYSQNAFAFRQLFWRCPPSQLLKMIPPAGRSPVSFWIYLCMRAGLIDSSVISSRSQKMGHAMEAARDVFRQFHEQGVAPVLSLKDWHFSRVRPANHPYVRMAALAQLIYHYQSPGLFQKLFEQAAHRLDANATIAGWSRVLRLPLYPSLVEVLPFFSGSSFRPTRTMGASRFRQFVINGLLPLLHTWVQQSDNPGFEDYLNWLLESMPGADQNNLLQKGLRAISDNALREQVERSAFFQQGLMELLLQRSVQNQKMI